MPKLLWVALPLLLASALVGLQVLRQRPPSKRTLNVGSSLLLLGYVLTTAGLGIFWVANQQLPVFDWHYLFGYGTVLLVAVHLAFNFRIVWSHWRSRGASSAPAPNTAVGRRGALGTLGWTMATGAAFAIGMRHGRTELHFGPDGDAGGRVATGAPAAGALARVEAFHAFSSHSRTHVLQRAPSSDWADAPPAFKRYSAGSQIALPAPGSNGASAFDVGALGTALWHTSGVTESRGGLALRAAPSSGALFSTELYVVARDVRGLSNGLWHYDPGAHRLSRIGDGVVSDAIAALEASDVVGHAQAFVVATAVFGRTAHKYRDRTYRYVLADLGHALENLRVATSALGTSAAFVAGFDESRIAAALGIDEAAEGVLAVLALGLAMPPSTRDTTALAVASTPWQMPDRMPAAGSPLPVTTAIHTATSLRRSATPTPDSRTSTRSAALPTGAIALPRATRELTNVLGVIAGRRSRRRFASTPLPLGAVGGVLDQALRIGPLLSGAVRMNVAVHAVEGVAPGSYRYDRDLHALLPRRSPPEPRGIARSSALDQDVVGDAAVVFVLSIDRAAFAADPLGPARGYRHAFLEAGLVGERIYLHAAPHGLAVCAVGAFYDDEAAAWVGVDPTREWVVHLAAMGPVSA